MKRPSLVAIVDALAASLMLMGQIGYTMHMARIDAWTLPETAPEPRGRN